MNVGEGRYADTNVRPGIFSLRAFPLPDACVGLAFENVTERRNAELTITRQAQLLDLASDAIFACDPADRITYWNQGAERVYGWTRTEAVGRLAHELLKPELPLLDASIKEPLFHKGYWQGELRHTRRDGVRITVASRWTLQRDRAGKPTGWLQINTDINERRQIEEQLNREREFTMRIIDSCTDGIMAFDRQCRLTVWNRAMEQLMGIGREQAKGRLAGEILPFLNEPGEAKFLEDALQGKSVVATDRSYRIPVTGRMGVFEADYSPIRAGSGVASGNGEVVGALAVIHDITAQKRYENSLRQLSARLLRLQDEERRRIALELHDSTSQMLAALSLNLARLNRMQSLNRTDAEIVSESSALAAQAARELRTLSYLLHPPELDEMGLATAVRSYVQGFSQRTGIQVNLKITPGFERLPQDVETTLFRILQEGLTNIHRHSGSQTAEVRLTSGSGTVALRITDHGRGMPAEIVSDAVNGSPELGVGVRGMRERVRQLQGDLEIKSNARGTTIEARIPRRSE
jgi:PAS domain S-box-containing protein